jgi:hypothetical protein
VKIVNQVSQRKSGQTVIAHISDLHFQADTATNDSILLALRNSLAETKPDLLFITGDLVDSSTRDNAESALQEASQKWRAYILSLCTFLQLDPQTSLFVVPGNHDYRNKGLHSRTAEAYRSRDTVGSYGDFTAMPGLNAVVFVFDSDAHSNMNLASGPIERERFGEFDSDVLHVRSEPQCNWYDCTKIALLGPRRTSGGRTEHSSSVAGPDEMWLLKNAGSFLRRLVHNEINLVFHGHKHDPNPFTALFPGATGEGHSVAFIAAGSVDDVPKHFPRSFNIVTLYDSGEQDLERKVLHEDCYETREVVSIRSYEQARKARFYDLAKKGGARVHASKYVRCDTVEAASGDTSMHEQFRGVHSLDGELVDSLDHTVKSRSGRFGDRIYNLLTPNQSVEWKWKEEDSGTGVRRAITFFRPPVKESPIDFNREGTTYNAIHFSQRDRLSATGHESKTEHVSVTVLQAYDSLAYQLLLPLAQWPKSFKFSVLDASNKPHEQERAYCQAFFTPIDYSHSVLLTVDRPLVGYTYKIEWDLPEEDLTDSWMTVEDAAMAEEIVSRLLAVREYGSEDKDAVTAAVQELAAVVCTLLPSAEPTIEQDLEITVFSYDKAKGGLVCVAAQNCTGEPDELWTRCVRPGRRIDGQAYRRRESMLYVNIPGVTSSSAAYYEQPKKGLVHRVVFSIPLCYPLGEGKPIAVVSFGTRSNKSCLLQLSECDDDPQGPLVELVEQLNAWFALDLAHALRLGSLLETDNEG